MLLPQLDQLSRHVLRVSVVLSDAPFGSFAQVQWQKKKVPISGNRLVARLIGGSR